MLKNIVLVMGLLLISKILLLGDEYKVSLAKMPVYAESKDKGVLIDLVKAVERVSGHNISIKVLPFSSSVYMVEKKRVDLHMPLIKNEIVSQDKLLFIYSDETLHQVNFVLYIKKGSDVSLDNLNTKNLETDRAHVEYFPFKIKPSNSIAKSLEKINSGKIDGFIFADSVTDPYLKKSNIKGIQRSLYKVFESKMILAKTDKAEKVNKMLNIAIGKLRKSGEMKKIVKLIDIPYNNWQP